MLRYRILWVGRRAQDPLVAAAQDYVERITHYAKIELITLREGSLADEGRAMLAKLDDCGELVALDVRGKAVATEELAQLVSRWERETDGRVTLVVGGADGLHPDVLARARVRLSLSKLTLPHRLALVVLTEQLYRAHTILRREPYHRA